MEPNPVTQAVGKLVTKASRGEEIRAVVSTPPRHGKTDTILRGFAWLLQNNPTHTHAYATYGQDLANSKSRRARRFATDAGVQLASDSASVKEWRTAAGGGLLATGVGGPLTGQGITGLGVVDDPLKNRQEAESGLIRERIWEWFNDVFYTRLEPGASALVVATRWHPDDLSGRLIADGWDFINLPALDHDNAALWPKRYDRDRLEQIKEQVGEYTWASLYQGEPRPKGGSVFNEPDRYDALPDAPHAIGHGFDAAYTAKTSADYSVTYRGRLYGDTIYVTHRWKHQLEPRQYASILTANNVKRVTWIRSGTEKGLEALLEDLGVRVNGITATTDKFIRAQPAAALCNAKKLLYPSPESDLYGEWVEDALRVLRGFTGLDDKEDDDIDALAGLHADLLGTPTPRIRTLG